MSLIARFGLLVLGAAFALPAMAAEPTVSARPAVARVIYVANLTNGFSIRVQRSEVRDGGVTRLYTAEGFIDVPTAQIASMDTEELPVAPQPRAVTPAAPDVPQLVTDASGKHQVDQDFIKSVIRAESNFNPKARSPKGAQGLMQLMPDTAQKLGVQDAYEPGANIDAGTQYLRQLLEQYHGDVAKALAAYNAGPQRVSQYNGVPPYSETRAYVRKVINDYNRAKRAEQKKKPAVAVAAKKDSAETSNK